MIIISDFCNITFSDLKILWKPETPLFIVNCCYGMNSMPYLYSWVTVAGTLKGERLKQFSLQKAF